MIQATVGILNIIYQSNLFQCLAWYVMYDKPLKQSDLCWKRIVVQDSRKHLQPLKIRWGSFLQLGEYCLWLKLRINKLFGHDMWSRNSLLLIIYG